MKPAARRRVEREIREIMSKDGDHCSLCRTPFGHNTRTFGGTTKIGKSALVGQCCEKKLAVITLGGLYLDNGADDMVSLITEAAQGSTGSGDPEQAIEAIYGLFSDHRAESERLAERAGLPFASSKMFHQQTAWKDDDARWFEERPHRSHRLRKPIGDEAVVSGFLTGAVMPPRHELQVIIRQVEPGRRARLPFGRNIDTPIPDDEAAIHALFDVVAGKGGSGAVISAAMLREAVEQQGQPSSARPS